MPAARACAIEDVIVPHATRVRSAGKFTQPAPRNNARALAMLRGKKVEMPKGKDDNLQL